MRRKVRNILEKKGLQNSSAVGAHTLKRLKHKKILEEDNPERIYD